LNTANVAKLNAFPFESGESNPLLRLEKAFYGTTKSFHHSRGIKGTYTE